MRKNKRKASAKDGQLRAIVMGASSGIGLEFARRLLDNGWKVGIAARRLEPLESLAKQYPGMAECAIIDITEFEATVKFDELIERLGGMDLYFHSSGIGNQNRMLEPEITQRICMTNVIGFSRMIDHAFNYFDNNNIEGQIAAISSVAGTGGLGVSSSYSATKAYNSYYMEALAQLSNIRGLGISITDVRPGFIKTALLSSEQKYPLVMSLDYASDYLYKRVMRKREVIYIDYKYAIICAIWKLIPRWLWIRLKLKSKTVQND